VKTTHTVPLALLLSLLASTAWPTPQGLAPVPSGHATGLSLHPPGSTVTAEAPAGWAWYRPDGAPEGRAIYVATSAEDTFRVVLTVGGSSEPRQFLDVMKAVEADLRQAWAARGLRLNAFAYKEPADLPGVLRYVGQALDTERRQQFVVGYVRLGRPTVIVQGATTSAHEPGQLRQVVASIGRTTASAHSEAGSWVTRMIYGGEAVLSLGLVSLVWHYRRRRGARHPSLLEDRDA